MKLRPLILALIQGILFLAVDAMAGGRVINANFDRLLITPDGTGIIGQKANEGILAHIELASGKETRTFQFDKSNEHKLRSMVVSPDGSFLAAAGDSFMKVWNPANGKLLKDWDFGKCEEKGDNDESKVEFHYVTAVAFSADSKYMAYAYKSNVPAGWVADQKREEGIFILKTDDWSVSKILYFQVPDELIYSPDGLYVSGIYPSNSYWLRRSFLRTYKISNGDNMHVPETNFTLLAADYIAPDTMLTVEENHENAAKTWYYRWEKSRFSFPAFGKFTLKKAVIFGDGKYVAVSGEWPGAQPKPRILVYDTNNGELIGSLEEDPALSVDRLIASRDGSVLLAQASNVAGVLTVWNLKDLTAPHEAEISKLNQLVEKGNGSATSYNERGLANLSRKAVRLALKDFSEAIRLSPKEGDFYRNRGMAAVALGDFKEALDDFGKAIELGGETAELLLLRGLMNQYLGSYPVALSDFEEGYLENPRDPMVLQLIAAARLKTDGAKEALVWYDLAVNSDAGNPHQYLNRADVYAGLNLLDKAAEDVKKAISLDPSNPNAFYKMALLQLGKGDIYGADSSLKSAIDLSIKIDDVRPEYYKLHGDILKQRGSNEIARDNYYESHLLNGDAESLFNVLLFDYEANKDRETSSDQVEMAREVIRRAPDNEKYKELLNFLSSKEDREGKARAANYSAGPRGLSGFAAGAVSASEKITAGITTSSTSGGSSGSYSGSYSSTYTQESVPGSSSSFMEKNRLEQDRSNRQQIEKKFWEMNDPFKRR